MKPALAAFAMKGETRERHELLAPALPKQIALRTQPLVFLMKTFVLSFSLASHAGCGSDAAPPDRVEEAPSLFTYEVALDGPSAVQLDMHVRWLDEGGNLQEHKERVRPPWWHRVPLGTGIDAAFATIAGIGQPTEEVFTLELRVDQQTRSTVEGRVRDGGASTGGVSAGQEIALPEEAG